MYENVFQKKGQTWFRAKVKNVCLKKQFQFNTFFAQKFFVYGLSHFLSEPVNLIFKLR